MRVFLSEYITSGALAGGELAASLLREGLAMRNALAADMLAIPDVAVVMTCDQRVPGLDGAECQFVDSAGEEERLFERLCRHTDATLIIAPESDGILLQRCTTAAGLASRLLNCDFAALSTCGDKLYLAQMLLREHVPTISTQALFASGSTAVDVERLPRFPLVLKPRWGAGSQLTNLCRDLSELHKRLASFPGGSYYWEPIVQPFIPGRALSVVAIFDELTGRLKQTWPIAEQHLSNDGCFNYLGGEVPIHDFGSQGLKSLISRVNRSLGFTGYVGFDLLIPDAEPDRPLLVEINPRLTTSYVGYRRLAASNLAAVLLGLDTQEPRWRGLRIRYTAAGEVEEY